MFKYDVYQICHKNMERYCSLFYVCQLDLFKRENFVLLMIMGNGGEILKLCNLT